MRLSDFLHFCPYSRQVVSYSTAIPYPYDVNHKWLLNATFVQKWSIVKYILIWNARKFILLFKLIVPNIIPLGEAVAKKLEQDKYFLVLELNATLVFDTEIYEKVESLYYVNIYVEIWRYNSCLVWVVPS